jgi:CheY-like chemotaxis protein
MSRHILVVDDDAEIRDVVQMILSAEGYDVTTAANGREALRAVAASRPAVMLLDLIMPVMDGRETLAQLRAQGIAVPVVIITAAYRAQTEAQALSTAGYLAKPFDVAALLRAVSPFVVRDDHPAAEG